MSPCVECHGSGRRMRALAADDLERLGEGVEAAVERRGEAGREAQQAGEAPIHAIGRRDLLAVDDVRLLARDEARAAHAVAAHVHERAALERGADADVRVVARAGWLNVARTATSSPMRGSSSTSRAACGRVAPHEGLHEHQAGGLGGIPGHVDLGGVARVGLLAEDVLAGRQRRQRPGVVHRVGQRDVDGIDLRVGQEGLVGAVDPADAVGLGERPAGLGRTAAHGHDLGVRPRGGHRRGAWR